MADGNGWTEYRQFVLRELQRMESQMASDADDHRKSDERLSVEFREGTAEINESILSLKMDVAGLKFRASVWGLAAGAIPTVIAIIILYLEKKL
jgi:hypothetical protein